MLFSVLLVIVIFRNGFILNDLLSVNFCSFYFLQIKIAIKNCHSIVYLNFNIRLMPRRDFNLTHHVKGVCHGPVHPQSFSLSSKTERSKFYFNYVRNHWFAEITEQNALF